MIYRKLNKYKMGKLLLCLLIPALVITSVPVDSMVYAEEEKKPKVTEVGDLNSFIQAVDEATRDDDLSPAYTFTKDSTDAIVNGEAKEISAPIQESGDTYIVPEEVFASDDAVNQEQITDGDGVVALAAVAEISDYEVVEQENSVELVNIFQSKRLIVKSPEGFDPYGAVSIIQGYDQIFVLTYETEEAAKTAYEYLKTIPYLTVEPDTVITAMTSMAEPAEETKETKPAENNTLETENHAVTVAVLDTGYDYQTAPSVRIRDGMDVSGSGTVQDGNGHGTAMANIILSATAETVSVLPIRITDDNGRSSSLQLYLGMEEALVNGADILNVSMSAYRPADASLIAGEIAKLKEQGIYVVTAAGNYGGNTADYVPANVEDAIVVSAINADDTADGYSNHGSTVDYSAYGSVSTTTLGGKEETISGTSVSAAIVSAVVADKKSKDFDIDYDAMSAYLDAQAKDLGEPGKDAVFGTGALYLDSITGNEEENWEGIDAEILTCDWKNVSDEELNTAIENSSDFALRYFLLNLAEGEREQLLSRDTLFNSMVTDISVDENGREISRIRDTLYNYLLSDTFKEYYIQDRTLDKTWSGSYWMYYSHNLLTYLYLDTNKDGDDAKIEVKVTQPAENSSVTAKVTFKEQNSAYDFSGASLGSLIWANDDNHSNVVQDIIVNGVIVAKPAHSKPTSQTNTPSTDKEGNAARYPSKFNDYGDNTCGDTSTENVVLYLGTTDLHDTYGDEGNNPHTLRMNFTTYGMTDWSDWSSWTITKEATCTEKGSKYRTRTRKCENCDKKDTDKETVEITAGHVWGAWYTTKYATCTEQGESRRDCSKCETYETTATDALGHLWPDAWEYNEHIHWKKCARTGCYSLLKGFEDHDFTSSEEIAATCTEKGTTRYTCTVCGYSYTSQDIPARGHDWDEEYIKTEPTCTTHGEKWHKCKRCGLDDYAETIFALDHKKSDDYAYEDAYGIKDAIRYEKCARCDTVLKKYNKYTLNVRYENSDGTFTEYSPEQHRYYLAYDDDRKFTFTPSRLSGWTYEANEIYQSATSYQPDYIGFEEYKCDKCYGEGEILTRDSHGGFQYLTCDICSGVGYIKPYYKEETTCEYCNGWGTHVNNSTGESYTCYLCNGTGKVVKDSRVMNRPWEDFVTVYRQKYTITFASTEPGTKNLPESKTVRAEEEFSLLDVSQPTAPKKRLYAWNTKADGSGTSYALYHTVTTTKDITLYAIWKPALFEITLDNQGADTGKGGTGQIYQMYEEGYYQDKKASIKFTDDRIKIPAKNIPEEGLPGNRRRQTFLGYYTQKDGAGYQVIKRDGTLISNINNAGDYKYFTGDTTIYAAWEDMYAIQFKDNLTAADMEILSRDAEGNEVENPVVNPEAQWKEKGESITINYETVVINNETFKDIYRLKGFSLTPEISSEDEIILSDEKTSYTFTADEDVVLYAQWDTSFMVTYVGNEQTEGTDYLDEVEDVTDSYTFSPNDEELVALLPNDTADYFVKTIEKSTIDIATGEETDEDGNPCMETVPCSFQGWSMVRDKNRQDEKDVYKKEDDSYENSKIILKAEEISEEGNKEGLTFGNPVEDYGTFNAPHMSTSELITGAKGTDFSEQVTMTDIVKGYLAEATGKPFVNMYAIWDEYPQIAASDLYFPLTYAQEGRITEEYLLGYAVATDEELKRGTNPDGKLKHGEDTVNKTKFTVLDYQTSDFLGAEADMAMTITYRAEDKVGNVTTKMVTVYLVDTTAQEYDSGNVRFISAEYADTLSEKSIWRTGEYAATLAEVLGNSKTGEEYTTVTALQQALGAEPVKKPGSGTWNHVEQVWKFTHEEVLEVHDYVDANGLFGSQDGFLSNFGHCRIQ